MQIQSVTANAEFTNAHVVRALVQRAISKFEPKPNSRFTDWGGKFHVNFSRAKWGQLRADLWITTMGGLRYVGSAILGEANHDSN